MPELLHELLTNSAGIYPDKTAVSYRDEKLTYRKLDELSDELSAICISSGVEAGDRTGIYIDKSVESVIAVFGILKSGACYVPLDPIAPVERHKLIINDCALEVLITSSKKLRHISRIVQQAGTLKHVLVLDITRNENKVDIPGVRMLFKDDIFRSGDGSSKNAKRKVTEKALAYMLYTSGSTGQPKGVMISHKAAMAFAEWAFKTFNIKSEDNVSSHAPFHFDLSVFDIYVSVMAGATIHLVPQGLSSFPKSIVDFIEDNNISTWYSVPSILIQLVLHGNLEERNLPSLRQVLFAGEVFASKYLKKLMELVPHAEYFNLYGPTETNVITYYRVSKPPSDDKTIPVGVPCDGVKSFIADKSGKLVPGGETGELYVECPTLMDGYWNDREKTEKVLFRNPFDPSSDKMIYRTGDLVNRNEQGELEYHGRCDAMIKSRGYRIELGEIEAVLSSHPGIRESAVTAVPDDETGNKIKAVIVPKSRPDISGNDIRLFCSKNLPHYMIPEIISFLDALPRTSTGKIDRKILCRDEIQ